jgi:hypothetical protein
VICLPNDIGILLRYFVICYQSSLDLTFRTGQFLK